MLTLDRLREIAAEAYAERPTGGTDRERRAWLNGFMEMLDTVANEIAGDGEWFDSLQFSADLENAEATR